MDLISPAQSQGLLGLVVPLGVFYVLHGVAFWYSLNLREPHGRLHDLWSTACFGIAQVRLPLDHISEILLTVLLQILVVAGHSLLLCAVYVSTLEKAIQVSVLAGEHLHTTYANGR